MRLLPPESFSLIFEPLINDYCGIVDSCGNPGDLMIHQATRQLCDLFGVRWATWEPGTTESFDRLLLFGGGNMGTSYECGREVRIKALATGIPCDLLPQSWMNPEAIACQRVFVRERYSLELHPTGVLAPDLALGLEFDRGRFPAPRYGLQRFLRHGEESVFPDWPPHDPARFTHTVEEYLRLAALHSEIITDRLHFAIAGLIAGRKTILLPNSYHKNRGMWECWLKDLGCEWSDHP